LSEIAIVTAAGAEEIEAARRLFIEYQCWLGVDLCFQGFEQELRDLPGAYGPPLGRLLLARVGMEAIGCVALRPVAQPGSCEMKRLYVRDSHRGLGLGRRLAERIITEARFQGYRRMVLDTLEKMHSALSLYRALGFQATDAYYCNPLPGVIYLALDLS
jgi:GNAT superfamily N-acetyltransferase